MRGRTGFSRKINVLWLLRKQREKTVQLKENPEVTFRCQIWYLKKSVYLQVPSL